METTLAKDLANADDKARYDEACRKLLADKHVLAWIMKQTVHEYRDSSIEDIVRKYIEGSPDVGNIPVDPDATNKADAGKIQGLANDDKSLTEGNIFYDIKFSALAPSLDEAVYLVMNIESQNDYSPGYPILKRGTYYCARMLSAQKGTIFSGKSYGKLRKVYSIWILANPPKELQNTVTVYETKERNLIGTANNPIPHYDMASIVLIGLGAPDRTENDVLKLLSVLLSDKVKPNQKKQILEAEFSIPMTYEMESEAEMMCNLSDGVEMRGFNRGVDFGVDKGLLSALMGYIRKKAVSIETALDDHDIAAENRAKYTQLLREQLHV